MRACAGSINGGVPMVSCVGGALGGGACRVCGRRGRARARAVALASCAGPSGTEAHCIERGEQRDQSGKESSELSERAAESLQEWRSSSLFSSQRRLLPRMTSSSHASARHAALSLSPRGPASEISGREVSQASLPLCGGLCLGTQSRIAPSSRNHSGGQVNIF